MCHKYFNRLNKVIISVIKYRLLQMIHTKELKSKNKIVLVQIIVDPKVMALLIICLHLLSLLNYQIMIINNNLQSPFIKNSQDQTM